MKNIADLISYTKNIKLLYVEDNADARESTQIILEEFFTHIEVAVDGVDGLALFKKYKFDLIITDINMPKMDGLKMIECIREINRHIPILIFSAYNDTNLFIDSIKQGVDGYLLKPIDMQQFTHILEKVTEKITLQTKAENSENFLQQYKDITDKSAIVSIIDSKGVITYANDMFCKVSEYSREELIGKEYSTIAKFSQPKDIRDDLWETLTEKKQMWQGVTKYISRSGKTYYLKNTIKPILDTHGDIVEYIAIRDDITETMNPHRLLNDRLKQEVEPLVVYLKLEDYETLESFYDAQTNELIQFNMAQYLETNVPDGCHFDKVYQLGNGEFVFTNNRQACMLDEEQFFADLKKLQNRVNCGAISLGGVEYDMSMVMSIAFEGDQVLESARLGVKQLLETKKDYIIANDLANIERKKAQKNIEIISMIKKAINELNIVSYFQPIINNSTQNIDKYESLVRLIDSNGNVLVPSQFLETSKDGRYYSQITAMVLENSFKALRNMQADISINISALDIEKDATRQKIIRHLDVNPDLASRVIFEILEDECVKDFEKIISFVQEVKSRGVRIAIDDFGAGYSNYERLLDYQPDIIKIDGSIVRYIDSSEYSLSIVRSIILFAKENKIKVVAEFVENKAIYTILRDLGVDYSQGYYFGKPEVQFIKSIK